MDSQSFAFLRRQNLESVSGSLSGHQERWKLAEGLKDLGIRV